MCGIKPSSSFNKINTGVNGVELLDSPNIALELSVTESNSSNGVLAKSFITYDGKEYLVKTGEFNRPKFSVLEPVTEVICCEIIKLLGIECANYHLKEVTIRGNNYWRTQKVYCSFSENFLKEGDILLSASKLLGVKSQRVSYCELVEEFGNLEVNNMLVIDYIINNTDRHLRNFGKIIDANGGSRFAPLYDHGFSLGQDLDSEYLESELEEYEDFSYIYSDCDYAKCCGLSNSSQLSNVEFTTVNLNIELNKLLSIVDKYSNLIPSYRLEFMKYLITRRYNYVRKIFSKDEGSYFRRDS